MKIFNACRSATYTTLDNIIPTNMTSGGPRIKLNSAAEISVIGLGE